MEIRIAEYGDLGRIMDIYNYARTYMRASGNPSQWTDGYPEAALLEDDIRRKQCYVIYRQGIIHGVFVFVRGSDPTYEVIENGVWLNDAPYGVIHRLAGDGKLSGLFQCCLSFCLTQIPNLRADTHRDNSVMRHLLEKNGFSLCGIIYVRDKSPRLAYQRSAKLEPCQNL